MSAARSTARRFRDGRSVTFFARSAGELGLEPWRRARSSPGSTVGSTTCRRRSNGRLRCAPGVHGRSSLSPATDTRRAPRRAAAGTVRTPGAPRPGCPRPRAPPSTVDTRSREMARERSPARPTSPPPARRRDAGLPRRARSAHGPGRRRARVASPRPTCRLHRAGTAGAPVTPPTQPPPVPGRARLRRALLPRPVRRSRLRTGRPTFPRAGRAGSSRTRLSSVRSRSSTTRPRSLLAITVNALSQVAGGDSPQSASASSSRGTGLLRARRPGRRREADLDAPGSAPRRARVRSPRLRPDR